MSLKIGAGEFVQAWGVCSGVGSVMIELNDVSYTYAQGTPFAKTALFNVSLKIGAGEFVQAWGVS